VQRLFAIGDIHGCNRTLHTLLFDTLQVNKTDRIVCIGDYIDRGPDSKGVVDTIISLRNAGYHIDTLRGNHEQIMMQSVSDKDALKLWLRNGGRQTLASFGVDAFSDLSKEYRDFFSATLFYLEVGKYLFVHAGFDFVNEDPLQDKHAMLTIRKFYPRPEWLGDRIIVHGHTPIPYQNIVQQSGSSVVNIDGGCVYPQLEGYGHLVALELHTMQFYGVRNQEM
jgi:serine/threonine protein phosphatase 1